MSFFLPLETSLVTTIFKHYMWKAFSSVWNGCLTLTFCVQRKHLYIPTIYLFCELSRRLWHCGRQVSVWLASCLCPIPSLSSCIFLPSLYCHIVKGTKAHKTSPKGVLVNFVYFVMTGRKSWDWSIIFIKSPGKIIISFSTAFNRKMPFYLSFKSIKYFPNNILLSFGMYFSFFCFSTITI